jgi:hypothetical protein
MVHEVRGAHALEVTELGEEPDRESLVDDAVVHDEVGEAEEGHAGAGADHHCAPGARYELAARDDEDHRDRRVESGKDVVSFETAGSRGMMGRVHTPESAMPDATVEQARPGLHRARHHDRGDRAQGEVLQHGRPPR